MLGIDFYNNNFNGGYNSVPSAAVAPSAETPAPVAPKGAPVAPKGGDTTGTDKQQTQMPIPKVNGDVVVVPERSSAVVYVRGDKQNYKRKILDFAEEYSRLLAVTFGVSAFLFNLGSTTVLNKRSLIWSGMAVVVVVVAFLVYHDREKLFGNTQLATKETL